MTCPFDFTKRDTRMDESDGFYFTADDGKNSAQVLQNQNGFCKDRNDLCKNRNDRPGKVGASVADINPNALVSIQSVSHVAFWKANSVKMLTFVKCSMLIS